MLKMTFLLREMEPLRSWFKYVWWVSILLRFLRAIDQTRMIIMEEPSNEEYYRSDYYDYDDDENRSGNDKMSWVVNKGLGIGKKLLFAGFVISSAPLTLPPLVVFSAIGFVVSIPSGLFLASYACSEKLMSALLPIPREKEVFDEEEEGSEEHVGKSQLYEIGEDEDEEEEINVVVYREEVVVPLEEHEEPFVAEEVIVVRVSEENEPVEIVEITTVVVQEKENGVEDKKVEDNNKKTETPQAEISTSKGDDKSKVSTAHTTTELPISEGPQETKDQPEISSEVPAKVSTQSANDQAKKKKNTKKKPSSQQPPQQPPPPPPSSQPKVEYDEKKIWEQIEAVRKIVGYKVSAQKTSVEELKALYIFTGVEPPATFKDPSDLAEVHDKLEFLKSIIGVN